MTELWFPRPPSLNNAFVNNPRTGGRFKSSTYKRWQAEALQLIATQPRRHHNGPVRVAYLVPSNRNAGDLGNYEKPISDILVAAGIIEDDDLIEAIFLHWSASGDVRARVRDARLS